MFMFMLIALAMFIGYAGGGVVGALFSGVAVTCAIFVCIGDR